MPPLRDACASAGAPRLASALLLPVADWVHPATPPLSENLLPRQDAGHPAIGLAPESDAPLAPPTPTGGPPSLS